MRISFENKDGAELAPARIVDAFGKMLVLSHVGDLQGLKIDGIVSLHERKSGFMVKVPSLTRHFLMLLPQAVYGLATAVTALFAAVLPPLRFDKCLFGFARVARVGKLPPVGERQERF